MNLYKLPIGTKLMFEVANKYYPVIISKEYNGSSAEFMGENWNKPIYHCGICQHHCTTRLPTDKELKTLTWPEIEK